MAILDDEIAPQYNIENYNFSDDNVFHPNNAQRVFGTNNRIEGSASFIEVLGSNNIVGGECRFVSITNSSGCVVNSNCQNVSIVNSSGQIVSESNVYINNNVYSHAGTQSSGGILKYVALLTQTGTNAPTAVVLENSLGTVSYGYNNAGRYQVTATGLLTENKTIVELGSNGSSSDGFTAQTFSLDVNGFELDTYSGFSVFAVNNQLVNTLLKITVYP